LADKDLYAYCLVRTDLPSLGNGKAIAHAMHAGNQMTYELMVLPLQKGKEVDPDVLAWHKMAKGFGTTIALGRGNELPLATVQAVVDAVNKLGGKANVVVDPTYPYLVDSEVAPFMREDVHTMPPVPGPPGQTVCFREEITTAYVFGDKAMLKVVLGQFGLYPND
jgi:hypothetical protein